MKVISTRDGKSRAELLRPTGGTCQNRPKKDPKEIKGKKKNLF